MLTHARRHPNRRKPAQPGSVTTSDFCGKFGRGADHRHAGFPRFTCFGWDSIPAAAPTTPPTTMPGGPPMTPIPAPMPAPDSPRSPVAVPQPDNRTDARIPSAIIRMLWPLDCFVLEPIYGRKGAETWPALQITSCPNFCTVTTCHAFAPHETPDRDPVKAALRHHTVIRTPASDTLQSPAHSNTLHRPLARRPPAECNSGA
jgi:hypothetical protein